MGSRRRSREQALQILYQVDVGAGDVEQVLDVFWEEPPADDEGVLFTGRLVRGVVGHRDEVDGLIETHSINWKLHRMPAVDRNILRLAVFEILHCDDIPAMVSINEAIELGKQFSTGESGAFINGILDKISKDSDATDDERAAEG